MQVFENCLVVLEVKDLPFKEKKRLKLAITDNGGHIAYVVNKQCTHVITNNLANVSSNRQRSIQKYQVPVVAVEYVSCCLEKGALLSVKEYGLVPFPSPNPPSQTGASPSPDQQATVFKVTGQTPVGERSRDQPKSQAPAPQQMEIEVERDRKKDGETRSGTYLGNHRAPVYPSKFDVAKYSIFEKVGPNKAWSVLELHSSSGEMGRQYRVVRYWSEGQAGEAVVTRDRLFHYPTSEEALEVYENLQKELLVQDFKWKTTLPPQPKDLGSSKLHQLLLEEKINSGAISQEVGVFVELLWTEALGCLGNILKIPLTSISLNDVSRAEGLLLQIHKALKEGSDQKQLSELMAEFYILLPHKEEFTPTMRVISLKLDLCQLIRDMLKVSEATLWNPTASCLGKYRALRCSIEPVPPESPDFLSVSKLLWDRPVQIQKLFRISRMVELQAFRDDLGNVRSLLHSSAPSNFVGIISRGLLLPRVGVEHHGIDRTDLGNLGGGIYFSDSLSTSLKYSKPGATDGSRLLLVCRVALGQCKDLFRKDLSLSSAPEGHHSVHGVRCSPTVTSDFEDDEYVVYQTDQVQMEYVVQFTLCDETVKTFQPTVDLSSEEAREASASDLLADGEEGSISTYRNRLQNVTAGLLDNTGQPLPLQAVHVKCKLMDLLTQVVIFQSYTNLSEVPIEAKYVFPLDESAAVCGFEAFINGKHVVGQVKEKEQARREYRQAIQQGHGAYLMDQDAPDVFTISVGNLPPGATVLIKVTYITELVIHGELLQFSLPGSVAPWQQSKALNQRTQVSVEKVCVNELKGDRIFTLDMSIEMPYKILDLLCGTHNIKTKKTDCRAVVSLQPGQTLETLGFWLCIKLSQVHLPRMWVENHPDKDSQACMLVFYPHIDPSVAVDPRGGDVEVVILLDTSESMRGVAMQDARRIAAQLLKALGLGVRINIISFGMVHKELFLSSQSYSKALESATKFVMSSPPVGGSTELWRPLRSLSLLPPSRGIRRNLLLISDGHVQNEALTLKLVRDSIQHTRVFTCGVSPTANRHMLRALAQAGGGAYEFFDTKTKHTWMEKVMKQKRRMAGPGCSSVSVKWQQFNPAAATPLQAPAQLNALFSDCQTLVYGFVPHCTQATLYGRLNEREIETVVSTSELQKTKGTLLHKLTARAIISDYEDGSLHADEAEHEGKKEELKSFIIALSKEYSIVTQYTSFVAIEERDAERPDVGFTDIPKLIAEEDVDFLPYMGWEGEKDLVAEPYLRTRFVAQTPLSLPVPTETYSDISDKIFFEEMSERAEVESQSYACSDDGIADGIKIAPHVNRGEKKRRKGSPHALLKFSDLSDSAPVQLGLARSNQASLQPSDPVIVNTKSRLHLTSPGSHSLPPLPLPSAFPLASASPAAYIPAARTAIQMFKPKTAEKLAIQAHSFSRLPIEGNAPLGSIRSLHALAHFLPPPQRQQQQSKQRQRAPFHLAAVHSRMGASHFASAPGREPLLPFGGPPIQGLFSGPEGVSAFTPQGWGAPTSTVFSGSPGFKPAYVSAEESSGGERQSEILLPGFAPVQPPPPPPPPSPPPAPSALPLASSLPAEYIPAVQSALPAAYIPAVQSASQMLQLQQQMMAETSAIRADSLSHRPMAFSARAHAFPPPPPPPPPSQANETQQKHPQQQQMADLCALSNTAALHSGFGASQFASTLGREARGVFGQPPVQGSLFGAVRVSAFTPQGWGAPTSTVFSGSPGFKPAYVSPEKSSGVEWKSEMPLPGCAHVQPPPPPTPSALPLASASLAAYIPAVQSALPAAYIPAAQTASQRLRQSSAIRADSLSHRPMAFSAWAHAFARSQAIDTQQKQQQQQQMALTNAAPLQAAFEASQFASTLGREPQFQFGQPPVQGSSFEAGRVSAFTPQSKGAPTYLPTMFSGSLGLKLADVSADESAEESSGVVWESEMARTLKETGEKKGFSMKSRAGPRKDMGSHGVLCAMLFHLQHQDGYWECSEKLGSILRLDLGFFASVFLKEKGIASLGVRAGADILKLVATLLVLQLLRLMGLAEGDLLKTLLRLKDSTAPTSVRGEAVKRAVKWVSRADRQYPCLCTRLELGLDWESVTRQLLGADSPHVHSPLRPVLERTRPILSH